MLGWAGLSWGKNVQGLQQSNLRGHRDGKFQAGPSLASSLLSQEEQMRQKASRARLTSSMLRTVRTIKSHGWEHAFLERLLHIRGQELSALKTSTLLFSVSLVSFQVSTFLVTSFWSHCRCQRLGRGHAWGGEPVPAALHLMDCRDTSVGSVHWK